MNLRLIQNTICLITVFTFSTYPCFAGEEANRVESRFAAERQYSSISESNAQLGKEVILLQSLKTKVESAKKCVDSQIYDSEAGERLIKTLNGRFQALKASPPNSHLRQQNDSFGAFRDFQQAFWDAGDIFIKLSDCDQSLYQNLNESNNYNQNQIDTQIIMSTQRPYSRLSREESAPLSKTSDFLNNSPNNLSRSDIQNSTFLAIEDELKNLSKDFYSKPFNELKKQKSDYLAILLQRVESEISNRQTQIKANDEKLANLDKALAEKQTSQNALDQSLVYSIWGMIAALTVLFISLRFFPEAIALRMIQDRSVVEVMSMAFILLTIIILGTGDRIGKEALGTLLGTIAGYIFGRKMGESSPNKNNDDEAPPRSTTPAPLSKTRLPKQR